MTLETERLTYKPFEFPWAYDAWLSQQRVHWLPEEVPLGDDVKDWKNNITNSERNLITQIFRFFTQSDVEVNNCYNKIYMKIFKPTEVLMMLTAFSNMETIHVAAYSYLLDTIGMPETEYSAFLEYAEMKDKFDYMRSFNPENPFDIALTMAAFGAFTEGVQLFASFAILLNFQRFNKFKGMGQIVTYSARDETIHATNIIKLFHQYVKEHTEIDRNKLKEEIYKICSHIILQEDKFIELAFKEGTIEGLTQEEVKKYIRYVANIRLRELNLPEIYEEKENPIPWINSILNGVEFAAFFEQRATEYSKAATTGTWSDVWDHVDKKAA